MKKVIPVNMCLQNGEESVLSTTLTDKNLIVGLHKECGAPAIVRREQEGYITREFNININNLQCGSSGHHKTLNECIIHDSKYYDFFVI